MGFEPNPIADCGSEAVFPTVEELISKLRSSFFEIEFQYVAKTLTEREQHIKQNFAKLLAKVEEEKSLLLSENLKLKTNVEEVKSLLVSENNKLNDELKLKHDEIAAVRKLNAEYERKFRVYAKRSLDSDDNVSSLEKIAKESMGSSINLKNKEQNDRATEINGPPLFNEREDSKVKTVHKMHEIIEIDDDDDNDDNDDDDQKCISTLKGKRVTKDLKREYDDTEDDIEFISTSKRRRVSKEVKRDYNTVLDDEDDDDDSGSDTEIKKVYMSTIGRMKKQKERWEFESDMVKDIEKDDDLCLNGVCALHRQRVIVHGTDISKMSDLACKLIDGDPQRKLKKKASELNHLDLDHCRMFAKKYSLQLFNIYQKKSDPFFPSSRS